MPCRLCQVHLAPKVQVGALTNASRTYVGQPAVQREGLPEPGTQFEAHVTRHMMLDTCKAELSQASHTVGFDVATAVPVRSGILRRHLCRPHRKPVTPAGHPVAAAGVRPLPGCCYPGVASVPVSVQPLLAPAAACLHALTHSTDVHTSTPPRRRVSAGSPQ